MIGASDGAAGVELAPTLAPAAIVLDLMMDGIDGFETAAELKRRPDTAQIPILVFTSKEMTAEDRERLAENTEAALTKAPEERHRLIATIRGLARRPAPRTARHERPAHLGD